MSKQFLVRVLVRGSTSYKLPRITADSPEEALFKARQRLDEHDAIISLSCWNDLLIGWDLVWSVEA